MGDDEFRGKMIRSFKEIVSMGVKNFRNIYKNFKEVNIAKNVKVATYFPQLVIKEKDKDYLKSFLRKN